MEQSAQLKAADLLIAVKPVVESFGIARRLSKKLGVPLLLDVDDPDLESVLSWQDPLRRLARGLLRRERVTMAKRLQAAAKSTPTIVSNPLLQRMYGGPIIPHVREDRGAGSPHVRSAPQVAFVGTARGHKGVGLLRAAIANRRDLHYEFVITDVAPADAQPWERWVGPTSMEEGQRLVAGADVVVIPSLDKPYARGQLPAKLIDAMLLGRAIAVTEVAPMPWALGSGGRIIRPGSARAIEDVLEEFRDPKVRASLGAIARGRALELFRVESNVSAFEAASRAAFREF